MNPITAIATVPAVIALVTIAKDSGLPPRLSPVLALALGVVLTLLHTLSMGESITTHTIWGLITSGLILGLSASGVYDGAKLIGERNQQ